MDRASTPPSLCCIAMDATRALPCSIWTRRVPSISSTARGAVMAMDAVRRLQLETSVGPSLGGDRIRSGSTSPSPHRRPPLLLFLFFRDESSSGSLVPSVDRALPRLDVPPWPAASAKPSQPASASPSSPSWAWPMGERPQPLLCLAHVLCSFSPLRFFPVSAILALSQERLFYRKPLEFMHIITN